VTNYLITFAKLIISIEISFVRMIIKKIARKLAGYIFFKIFILFFLNNFPTLKSKLQAYIFGGIIVQRSSLLDAKNLTRSSELIYSNLKKLIKK
jgi:hypothetical protein